MAKSTKVSSCLHVFPTDAVGEMIMKLITCVTAYDVHLEEMYYVLNSVLDYLYILELI